MNPLQKLFTTATIAALIFGFVISIVSFSMGVSPETSSAFSANLAENPAGTLGKGLVFVYAYQMVTPAKDYDWFGDPEKHTPFIEEFPLPDSRDLLVLVPFWLGLLVVARQLKKLGLPYWKLALIVFILFVVGTLLFWMLYKLVAYMIMTQVASEIGFAKADLLMTRQAEFDNISASMGMKNYLTMIGVFSVVLLYSLLSARKKDEP
ncbi:hypothetical protein GOV10_05655 [Candidatus Woesearchaeota archaeon]|nr:hypothetical protein [Candidatus Woesearchaeota archaeon]